MDMSFLYDDSGIKLPALYKSKNSWLEWFRLRRRKPNSEEEINEIHELILNVYESMDDQARAVLLSLSKVVQDEDESTTIEEKIKAIVAIGHSLCCTHMQVKNATQLYSKLLIRALSHQDLRMRLAAMIAIAETAIDNLSFQMKVIPPYILVYLEKAFSLTIRFFIGTTVYLEKTSLNEIGIISKLFEIMKTSMPYAGRTLDAINEHSKLVAWSCYTIINICANCMPNILLLKDIVPSELQTLNDAVQLEIWRYVWRENYAQTIVQFVDSELASDIVRNAIQPKPDFFASGDDHIAQLSNTSSSVNNLNSSTRMSFSTDYTRCTIL